MVSSRRQESSPTSSCPSYSDLWELRQDGDAMSVDKKRGRGNVERLFDEDDREVARRVLEDLESIYFDGSGDEESEDEGEYDSRSEWGSDLSSCSSRFSQNAGGMTLEELTVAVNAAIEYHRPRAMESTAKVSKDKTLEVRQRIGDRHRHRRRHHRQYQFTEPSFQTGESAMEMFQDMLKRKQEHFYALRATGIAAEVGMGGSQDRETSTRRTVTTNQQQQTTSYVRDQATETEEFENSFFHYPILDESAAEIDIPLHSPSPGVAPYELMDPAGPTLADLAHSHRRNKKHPLSSQVSAALEASKSSSSSSSTTDPAVAQVQSSSGSRHNASRGSSSTSSRSSAKNDTCCRHSKHTNSKGNGSSRTSNKMSSSSTGSKCSSRTRVSRESSMTTQPNNFEMLAPTKKDHAEEFSQLSVVSLPSDPPPVPSRPELVAWELDLSNFAF